MDLFDRLFEDDETKIPIHYFRAAMGDYAAGYTTKAQIITAFDLDSEAQTDLNVLTTAIDAMTALQKAGFLIELHDVLNIAEGGYKYTTKSAFKTRLGL